MMKYGSTVDIKPRNLSGYGGLYVNGEYLPFWWDNENFYYNIEKSTEEDIEELKSFNLNLPIPNDMWETLSPHQTCKKKVPPDIIISEWRKRLAMLPEEIVQQTINNTTNFYLSMEEEHWHNPRRHYRYRLPRLIYPR